MVHQSRLRIFEIAGVMGLNCEGNQLTLAMSLPDYMSLSIYEPGKEPLTIVSTNLGDIHDVRMVNGELYVVSTGTNEIVIVDAKGRIKKQWRFDGYSDSWHVNCLDVWNGRLVASAFGKFETYRGYKHNTKGNGIVFDIETKEVLKGSLSAPHTPRHDDNGVYFVCDSSGNSLVRFSNQTEDKLDFPGAFTRGIAITNDSIYLGLSSLRSHKNGGTQSIETAQVTQIDRRLFKPVKSIALEAAEIYDILVLN